jgi:hypothetical protein
MKIFLSDLHLFASSLGQDQGRGAAGGQACYDAEEHKPFLLGSFCDGGRVGEVGEANGASP